MLVLQTDGTCTDTSLPILQRDALLENSNGGVPWLFDMASVYGYPAQAAPANGQLVVNLDASGNNGSVREQTGDSILYTGRGLNFDGVTMIGNALEGPAAAAASVWAAPNQYFIACGYFKLPTSGNWNTAGALFDIYKWANTTYLAGPDLVLFAQQAGGDISVRRQTAAATADVIDITPNALDYGAFVQLAFWRSAAGQFVRLKSANGVVSGSAAVGSNNTQNFSALIPQLGVPRGFKGSGDGATMAAAGQNAAKMRVYRCWLENSVTSGRDPTTVLDADYTRTVARAVYS
jgi:hypothetical protein